MEKTYTTHEIKKEISLEMLEEIKKESQKVHYRISHDSSIYYDHKYVSGRAREVAFKGAKYKTQSQIYKNLLAANIAFPDDEKFIGILLKHGLTMEMLDSLNNPEILPVDKLKIIYSVAYTLKNYFGSTVTELGLNKINEIIAFNPVLFTTNEQTHPTR